MPHSNSYIFDVLIPMLMISFWIWDFFSCLCCRTLSCLLWLMGHWSPSFVKTMRMTRKSINNWTRCKYPYLLSWAMSISSCSLQVVEIPSKFAKTCWCETNKQAHKENSFFPMFYAHKSFYFLSFLLIAWILYISHDIYIL